MLWLCKGGEWASPLPYGLEDSRHLLVFVVTGHRLQATGHRLGSPRRSFRQHTGRASRNVFTGDDAAPRPDRGDVLFQRLLQGYAFLTDPEHGPASGATACRWTLLGAYQALAGHDNGTLVCASLTPLNIGIVCLSPVIVIAICGRWDPSRTLQIHTAPPPAVSFPSERGHAGKLGS